MNSHPTRRELILAALSTGTIPKTHMADCDWCSMYFELYSKFHFAGELPLLSAPKSWIEKAIAVEGKTASNSLGSLVPRFTFDSWAIPIPKGIRSAGAFEERRLCYEVSGKTLDLRAEHRQNRWDFTAKITDESGAPAVWALVVGNEELSADADGFYQWSSVRPPKKLRFHSVKGKFETPEISWKKSQKE